MQAAVLEGRRILLVEDDYLIVSDLASAFAGAGAEIAGPVATVREALAVVSGDKPLDGAVLDIVLQGEPVYPVADALARRRIPFVFATGYDAATIPAAYVSAPRCEKPVEPDTLARLLLTGGKRASA